MPQVFIAAAIGAGVYAGFRILRLAQAMIATTTDAKVATTPTDTIGEKDLGRLEYDPASGVYRPRAQS
jgi:hypothetical protein